MKYLNRNLFVGLIVLAFASTLFANLSLARNIENKTNPKAVSDSLCTGHNAPAGKKDKDDQPVAGAQSQSESESTLNEKINNGRSRIIEGRMLFYDRGCIVCHTVRNRGGRVGPSLDGSAKRHSRQYVASRISDAEFVIKLKKDGVEREAYAMPPSGLTKDQASSLADYIMTLP